MPDGERFAVRWLWEGDNSGVRTPDDLRCPGGGTWLAGGVITPFSGVLRLPSVTSTNTVLRERATADPQQWPHLSVLVADHQTEGRGRTDRQWHTPPGTALTASILLRPQVPAERLSWLTLLAGLATVRALRTLAPRESGRIGLKWPNDVLVDGAAEEVEGWGTHRKVAGILAELIAALPSAPPGRDGRGDLPAVVVGIGINLRQQATELPVPWATSLELAGIPVPAPVPAPGDTPVPAPGDTQQPGQETEAPPLLAMIGHELSAVLAAWEAAAGDVTSSGLRDAVADVCLTLGRHVRADQPGAAVLTGTAEDIDDDGRLVVRDAQGGRTAVVAGDISHLRHW